MSTFAPDPDSDDELLDPRIEAELFEALACAVQPQPISDARNQELIDSALEDPLAEPAEAEIVESERLRRALEGDGEHPALGLVHALRSASAPTAGAELAARRALAEGSQRIERSEAPESRGPARVYALFGGAAAVLALAAAIVLLVVPVEKRDMPASAALNRGARIELLPSHSTQPLFTQKFEAGEASARIDRIALARSRELRDNRYALWGVR